MLAVEEVALDEAADVGESVGGGLGAGDVDFGLDPFGHGGDVLPGFEPVFGLDDGVVGLDHVLAGEGRGGCDAGFPFAADVAVSRGGGADLAEGLVAGAGVDFDGEDLD